MTTTAADAFIAELAFDDAGLIPAIAQQWDTGEVLMLAWMNADSVRDSIESGRATYWSRSRRELWRKGDTSGHVQTVKSLSRDCDSDALLIKVDQQGPACHTGLRSCFDTAEVSVTGAGENTDLTGGQQ